MLFSCTINVDKILWVRKQRVSETFSTDQFYVSRIPIGSAGLRRHMHNTIFSVWLCIKILKSTRGGGTKVEQLRFRLAVDKLKINSRFTSHDSSFFFALVRCACCVWRCASAHYIIQCVLHQRYSNYTSRIPRTFRNLKKGAALNNHRPKVM